MKLTAAQVAAIKALETSSGRIAPQAVVKAAKHKASPLHGLFDWNVEAAAGRWWLQRAREIIGAVTVLVVNKETTISAPCYVVDMSVDGAGYRSAVSLKTDPESARDSLVYTLEVAAGHLRRAYDLAGPLGLELEIDALVRQIVGLTGTVRQSKKCA